MMVLMHLNINSLSFQNQITNSSFWYIFILSRLLSCKKTKGYFTSNHVSNDLKKQFQDLIKVFHESCAENSWEKAMDKVKIKPKAPKKGFTCKKKLCNAGGRNDAAAVSVFAAAAAAIYATKRCL